MNCILFDLTKTQPICGVKFHGGGKYGIAVFKQMVKQNSSKLAVYYNESIFIETIVMELCRDYQIPMYKRSEGDIVSIAKKIGAVIYSPLYDSGYAKDQSVLSVVTIHGLRVLEMPSDENENLYAHKMSIKLRLVNFLGLRSIVEKRRIKKELNNQRIALTQKNLSFVTVSNHSKYSILSFIPELEESNLRVFYSPSTVDDFHIDEEKKSYGKYYLMVSANRWLKNAIRGIRAFDELFTERPELEGNVVITGLKQISDLKINVKNLERFVCVGYVDEVQLKKLYQNAFMLLYPSLNEGFGYPPLEAMHEGCPVAASAIASIPEICGDAVLYFNPYSIAEMKMRILQMENPKVRQDFIEKGKKRQKQIEDRQKLDLNDFAKYLLSFVE